MPDASHIRKPPIIEYPENYEDMKKKLIEREDDALERVLEKRGVETKEELKKIAELEVVTRIKKSSVEHKPVKDHTILVNPKSEEIQTLQEKLREEISTFARGHLGMESPTTTQEDLKGRIKRKDT